MGKVQKGGKTGFINRQGDLEIPFFGKVKPEKTKLTAIKEKEKYGYKNKRGRMIIPPVYDYGWRFFDGIAMVEREGKRGYIDKRGQVVIPIIHDDLRRFFDGLAMVEQDGKYGYIDKKGKVAIPAIYDNAGNFVDGLAIVAIRG